MANWGKRWQWQLQFENPLGVQLRKKAKRESYNIYNIYIIKYILHSFPIPFAFPFSGWKGSENQTVNCKCQKLKCPFLPIVLSINSNSDSSDELVFLEHLAHLVLNAHTNILSHNLRAYINTEAISCSLFGWWTNVNDYHTNVNAKKYLPKYLPLSDICRIFADA